MEQNDLLMLSIPKIDGDDVKSFCKLNEIDNIDNFLYSCFKKGYYIEKYGLLTDGEPVFIEKVVEKIVEVEKIFHDESKLEEERQKFSTKIEEMEKIFQNSEEKNRKLEETLQNLRKEILTKNSRIEDLESVIKAPNPEFLKARYMVGSNIGNLL
jgi:DNA repair exonuclease SbcCD ATPase subunit